MPGFLGRRRLLGGGVVVAGAATIAATLAFAKPAANARAAFTSGSFLILTVNNPDNGKYPKGSNITFTVTVSNSSGPGIGDSKPGVRFFFNASTLSEVSGGNSSWTCSALTSGDVNCSDGTVSVGKSSTFPVVFNVLGNVGRNAGVEYSVTETASNVTNENFLNTDQTDTFVSGSVENPASYDKSDAQSGAFTAKAGGSSCGAQPGCDEIYTQTSSTSMTFTDTGAGNVIVLRIPVGAFNNINAGRGTVHISVYRANSSWSASFSSRSQAFIDGYGVAWTGSGSSTGTAAASTIVMVVSNTTIKSTDTLFRATTSGIGTQTGSVVNGAWTVSFTTDPGFVLAQAAAAPSSSSSSTVSATITAPAGGGGGQAGTSGGGAALPIGAGVLLVIVGTVIAGTGRRRRLEAATSED